MGILNLTCPSSWSSPSNLLFLLSFWSQLMSTSFFQLLWPKGLEAFMTHYFLSYAHPLCQQFLLASSSNYIQNLTVSHLSTANTQIQSIIIFCLDYCNNLLTGFFPFTLAPSSTFSHVGKGDFVKTCQIMLSLCSKFSVSGWYLKTLAERYNVVLLGWNGCQHQPGKTGPVPTEMILTPNSDMGELGKRDFSQHQQAISDTS